MAGSCIVLELPCIPPAEEAVVARGQLQRWRLSGPEAPPQVKIEDRQDDDGGAKSDDRLCRSHERSRRRRRRRCCCGDYSDDDGNAAARARRLSAPWILGS